MALLMYTQRLHHLMEISLFLFHLLLLVNPVSGSATFSIKVQEFLNPDYLNIFGDCCDGVKIDGLCTVQCSYTFKVCFSLSHCIPKEDLIPAGDNVHFSSKTITTSFQTWEPITMNITVYDEDTQSSDLIDEFFLTFKQIPLSSKGVRKKVWIQREVNGTRKQKPARLKIEMLTVCEKNFFQENCSVKCVAQNECSGHYTCGQQGEKMCNDGWSGEECKKPSGASKICAKNETCDNGGICARQRKKFYCCCPHKYEGRHCEKLKTCNKIPCENGAVCLSSGLCSCKIGFSGPFCEMEITTSSFMDIMTTENISHATLIHECPEHFYGLECDVFCQPQDNNINGSYTCNKEGERVCKTGWLPPFCQVSKINCTENECRNNGKCVAGKCYCPRNFKGLLCQIEIVQCANRPCENGGTCEDQIGNFRCLCQSGFTGIHCEFTLQELSTTQSSSIFSNDMNTIKEGMITNNGNIMTTYWETISCPPNKYGDLCDVFCIAEDNNVTGHWMCDSGGEKHCKIGWTGLMCTIRINIDLICSDEPLIYCRHGECFNNSCHCSNGFQGLYCQSEILECLSDPCQNGGLCTDDIGTFMCLCKSTFTGNTCNVHIMEHTEMTKTYNTKSTIGGEFTNETVSETWEHITNLPKSTTSPSKVNESVKTTSNDRFVSTNSIKNEIIRTTQQNRKTVAATVTKTTKHLNTDLNSFNSVMTFKSNDISTDSVISYFPISTQHNHVSYTEESNDILSTTQASTAMEEVTPQTITNHDNSVASASLKQNSIPVSTTQSTSLKTSTDGFLSVLLTSPATIKTPSQHLMTIEGSDVITNKQTKHFDETTTLTVPILSTQGRLSEPMTTSFTNKQHVFTASEEPISSTSMTKEDNKLTSTMMTASEEPISSTSMTKEDNKLTSTMMTASEEPISSTSMTKEDNKLTSTMMTASEEPISSTSMTKEDNKLTSTMMTSTPPSINDKGTVSLRSFSYLTDDVTVNSISKSTVTKTSRNKMSNSLIPAISTASPNSEYVTNIDSVQTVHSNGVTKMMQPVPSNFTIFIDSWVSTSKGLILEVIKLAWQNTNNKSSTIDFHVKTLAVFLCLTRNGQKVTELIFSISYEVPSVDTITSIFKGMGYPYEVYIGPRPWRYEYHYTLFIKGREEQPLSMDYKAILTKTWLKAYSEFQKDEFEIAIVLTERYLLPNGLDVTKFTYFVLSNHCLVDPDKYPAPSLNWNLPVLSESQKNSVSKYKDAKNVFITKTIDNKDYAQLERILQKSLTETFKELNKNESSDLKIQILKKEKFITLDRKTVWKIIFKIFNSTSIISFPQIKLNDSWFDHLDNNLNSTEPFKQRRNRVYRNNTAIDTYYTYAIVFNGVVPYKLCNILELGLLKIWRRNSATNAQEKDINVNILQIIPHTGDYGSEAAMVIYAVYNRGTFLNPHYDLPPSTDELKASFSQGPFYGIYLGNRSLLIPNELLYSFTINCLMTAFGDDGFKLRTVLRNVSTSVIPDHLSDRVDQMQIFFAKPKLVVTENNSIVSKVRYFILNNSIPLNPKIVDDPEANLLMSAGVGVYDKPIRPLRKLEVNKPYVNLRQLRRIQSGLIRAWKPKGNASVKIYTTTKEQVINNTSHIHTRIWYFLSSKAALAFPDFSFVPDYLDFDANRRLYRINILNAYKKTEKNEVMVVSLKNAWAAANKGISTHVLHPIIHSWDNNYHMATWGFITQVFYSLTVEGIESSLTALSEPALKNYEHSLQNDAKIGLCNCTALRGHFVYLLGGFTASLLGQIENALAVAWKNANTDFTGNIKAQIRTVDDTFESTNKEVSKITYVILPTISGLIVPDEELQPITENLLVKTFDKYLPTLKVLTSIPSKRRYYAFWYLIVIGIVVGSIIILLFLLCVLYAHRKRVRSREENLITDPKLLKGYNREHFASEPESPRELKNTSVMHEDSSGSNSCYSTSYRNQIISGSYDIISTNSPDIKNNVRINTNKSSGEVKHAVKVLPPKDNTNVQLENVHLKEGDINQFRRGNTAKEKGEIRSNEMIFSNETQLAKLEDAADMKIINDDDDEIKKQAVKKTNERHVTINLNSITSYDSNKKNNEDNQVLTDSEDGAANRIDVRFLDLPTDNVATINICETSISNQKDVTIEND